VQEELNVALRNVSNLSSASALLVLTVRSGLALLDEANKMLHQQRLWKGVTLIGRNLDYLLTREVEEHVMWPEDVLQATAFKSCQSFVHAEAGKRSSSFEKCYLYNV
jgi:hypothetical protein